MPSATAEPQDLKFFNIVDGRPRTSKENARVINPRTEEELPWDAPVATRQDLDDAVKAGEQAFKAWKKSTVSERQKIIGALAQVCLDELALLTNILAKETGKSMLSARLEVERASWHADYYARVALDDELQYEDDEVRIIATHHPYGVIGAISPWNFPLILSIIKVAAALVTGNCVIIKPSPFTPYTMLKFCELAQRFVPPGVYQALSGAADLGEKMTLHPGIPHISFTGTIAVGKQIMRNCAGTLKKVILELAGNDASIVTQDVDLPKTVADVAGACLFHAGQMCVASKRIYVHEAVYHRFLELLKDEVAQKYAANEDPEAMTVFGPISNKANFERCKGFVEDCRKNGFEIVTGAEGAGTKKGFWIPPTIVANPPDDSLVVQEEQFGPVIPVMSWSDEENVIERANLDNAGLGASVHCRDLERAQRIAKQLECGMVWINMAAIPHKAAFFAGQKLSGVGGELGKQGLLSYCHTQSLEIAK